MCRTLESLHTRVHTNPHTLKLLFTLHPYSPCNAHTHFLPLRLPSSPLTSPLRAPLSTQVLSAYKSEMEIPLYFWFSNLFFPHEAISCFIWFLGNSQLTNFSVDWTDSITWVNESVASDSLQSLGPEPTRVFCSWNSPRKDTGVGCHFFLQGIFPVSGIKPQSLAL